MPAVSHLVRHLGHHCSVPGRVDTRGPSSHSLGAAPLAGPGQRTHHARRLSPYGKTEKAAHKDRLAQMSTILAGERRVRGGRAGRRSHLGQGLGSRVPVSTAMRGKGSPERSTPRTGVADGWGTGRGKASGPWEGRGLSPAIPSVVLSHVLDEVSLLQALLSWGPGRVSGSAGYMAGGLLALGSPCPSPVRGDPSLGGQGGQRTSALWHSPWRLPGTRENSAGRPLACCKDTGSQAGPGSRTRLHCSWPRTEPSQGSSTPTRTQHTPPPGVVPRAPRAPRCPG